MNESAKIKSLINIYPGVSPEGPTVIRSAPGLSPVTVSELKFRGLIHRKNKPLTIRQRNHDLIFLPKNNNLLNAPLLHTAEEVHYCLLFGRYKISDSQLKRLSKVLLMQKKPFRVIITADGKHFARQDLSRFLNRKLQELRVPINEDVRDVLWVFCIDESYYICLTAYTQAAPAFRNQRVEERTGSLPPTIAASLAFLGNPQPADIALDPFCGTGTLLAEMNGFAPDADLFGFDLDANAIDIAKKNLAHISNLKLVSGDGTHTDLPDESVTLFLSNLPFGKQYGDRMTNPVLYKNAVAEMLRLGVGSKWRAVLLTSDTDSLAQVIAANKQLKCSKRMKLKVRGEWAEIFILQPAN